MRISDWSSDVCSSDLAIVETQGGNRAALFVKARHALAQMAGAVAQSLGIERLHERGWIGRRAVVGRIMAEAETALQVRLHLGEFIAVDVAQLDAETAAPVHAPFPLEIGRESWRGRVVQYV